MGFYIGNGKYYEGDKAAGEDIEVAQRPSPQHVFVGNSWVLDLMESKRSSWEKIKARRIVVMGGGVQVGASWFHSDETSRIQQLGLKDEARDMLAAGAAATDQLVIDGSPVIWKTMSGSFVPMTVQLALDIVAAVKVLDKRAHTAAEGHRIAMEAAADPAAYNFSASWPAVFPQGV
ncbi:DUF4376 domain-containing protein [Sideroxydans lithotrophicus]|uniref:DUF4376 domain-containing protein n=1 Tax=Sideroxydans lithotrophicus (strain ES-1) TaxID=580332 RepID=D5CUF4_SIDLE|nr:DUF4376 domain-containing protein [Sideroxydans lithotrophicus]ADE10489.1 hypothetical protein Slit_0247 [Sideroxydans lithotrophicus ES-1]